MSLTRTVLKKLLLLLIYSALVFVTGRIVDTFKPAYQKEPRLQIIDPYSLNARELRLILETRGVSCNRLIEKNDFATAAAKSGSITQDEINDLVSQESDDRPAPKMTYFYEAMDFYNAGKRRPWLVRVYVQNHYLDNKAFWNKALGYANSFQIPVGEINCSLYQRFCSKNNIIPNSFLLTRWDGSLHLKSLTDSRFQVFTEWINEEYSIYVESIKNLEDLEEEMIGGQSFGSRFQVNTKSKVIFFTQSRKLPLFFSALSYELKDDVKFKMFYVDLDDSVNEKKLVSLGIEVPSYVVITPYKEIVYGKGKSEHFNFKSMNQFFTALKASENLEWIKDASYDFVRKLFIIVLILPIIQGFIHRMQAELPWSRYIIWSIYSIIKDSITGVAIVVICGASIFDQIRDCCLRWLLLFAQSKVGILLRSDWRFLQSHPTLFIITVLVYGVCSSRFVTWPVLIRQSPIPVPNIALPSRNRDQLIDELRRTVSLSNEQFHYPPEQFHYPPEQFHYPPEQFHYPPELFHYLMTIFISNEYIKELPVWTKQQFRVEADEGSRDTEEKDESGTSRDSTDICVVCFETFTNDCLICDLPCGHEYHKECIEQWLPGKHSCPICRLPANKKTFRRSFIRERVVDERIERPRCSKCKMPIPFGSAYSKLPCGHEFHKGCLNGWLSEHSACPRCRWPPYKQMRSSVFTET